MDRFSNKVVVITGGGSGLGRECALWWAGEGGKVAVTDINEERALCVAKEIAENGGTAIGLKADVTVEDDIAGAVAAAMSEWSQLDIMFANAGVPAAGFGTIALEDVTSEQWDETNDVVFKGVFLSAKHACRAMRSRGGNIVVTVSAGAFNAYPGFGPYNAGKAGTAGLIRSMAMDWGKYGIRTNGLVPTHGMSVNFARPSDADVTGQSYEEAALAESGGQWDARSMFPGPLKVDRPPSLRDNAAVATFLASDDSAYMSGVLITSCDGGSFARTSIPIPENWSLEDEG